MVLRHRWETDQVDLRYARVFVEMEISRGVHRRILRPPLGAASPEPPVFTECRRIKLGFGELLSLFLTSCFARTINPNVNFTRLSEQLSCHIVGETVNLFDPNATMLPVWDVLSVRRNFIGDIPHQAA
ncbi:unnamed protein product [Schistocephalus solidus]|uniref:Uncharacterized protein n=1 Tax=Schistocephalus solidus TaxID=70667 RepID=A0A183TLY2_SCHSO|nr:unnamed protein product [Schistocephalus solidus]